MKKTFTLAAFLLTSLAIVKYSNLNSKPASTPNGGYTGAPTTNLTCASSGCHSGSPVADPSKLLLKMALDSIDLANSPVTSATTYIPGTTYWMSLELPGSGGFRWGFSMTALDNSNAQAGSFTVTNTTTTTLVNGSKDMSHKNANTTKAWIWKWNAPATTTPVNFYYVGMYANGDGNDSGDEVYKTSTSIAASTGIKDNELVSSLGVFPTQTFGDFAMNIESVANCNATIEVISLSGASISTLFDGKLTEGENNMRFNISDLSSGNYLISVNAGGTRITKPLFKL